MKNGQKKKPVLEKLAREMQTLSEAEQREYIGGDYWDDHGVWSMDSNGNWHWIRTSSGSGSYYGDSGDYGSGGYYSGSGYYGNSGYGSGSGIITQDQFFNWNGDWPGGYVEGLGYVAPNTIIYGSSGYGSSGYGSGDYGSGDYGSSGDFGGNQYREPQKSSEYQNKWESIKYGLFNQAQYYNIDLSKLEIIGVGNDTYSNAWVGPNKEVCLEWRFFNLEPQQQLRVLFEEYFHIIGDKPINTSSKKQIILPQPPEGVKQYLMAINNFDDESEFQKWFDKEGKDVTIIDDPNYNWNEVNANTKTKELVYKNLSEKGRNEIDYKIWFYNIALNAANNN